MVYRENLEILRLFAQTGEENREIQFPENADQSPTATRPVQFGHNQTVETETLVEDPGLFDRITAKIGIHHQE